MLIKNYIKYISPFFLFIPSLARADDNFELPVNMLTDMYKQLTEFISGNLSGYIGQINEIFLPIMGACFGLYFVWKWGLIHYKGDPNAIQDMLINGLKLVVIMSGIIGSGWYVAKVVPFVMDAGDEIAQKLVGSNGTFNALETVIQQINENGKRILKATDELSLWDSDISTILAATLALILFYAGGTAFVIYAAATMLIAKFMVGLLLIVGPLYLMMAMYEQTATFTKQWIGQAFNYILLNVFVTLTIHILIQFMNNQFPAGQEIGLGGALYALIAFLMGVFIIGQIPSFVSTITGGSGISGITGATNAAGGLAFNTASGVGGLAAKGAAKGLGKLAKAGLGKLRGGVKAG
ncbi:type IV secretion system protein [Salmonella enterica]|nr:conjugal transfer protein TraA [Salmonella enterica]EEV2805229.1 type IV secretion system protein [Escherichia coli]EFC3332989.1 type IV secretion system protein [Escherichia coli]